MTTNCQTNLKIRTMKTCRILLFFLSLPVVSFAQVKFESGYLIDSANQRIECFIRNPGWLNNPKEIEYKFSENEEIRKADMNTILEFGINDGPKYIVEDVEIDRSQAELSKLSKSRNPDFSRERLFLKVLVEGTASLYYYSDYGLHRFFFKTSDKPIQQLVYKEYIKEDGSIASNFLFRQQLWANVKCEKTNSNTLNNISYSQSELVKYFEEYNVCLGNAYTIPAKEKPREVLNFKIISGLDHTSLSILSNINNHWNSTYPNKTNLRIGLEIEMILPFHRNKWGITIEPSYFCFKGQEEIPMGTASIDYGSIEFPIGIRHYFHLNENSKIFLAVQYIPTLNIDSKSTIIVYSTYYDVNPLQSFAFSGGLCFKRISAELKYYTNRDLLGDYINWSTDYQRFSILLGYKFIKIRN